MEFQSSAERVESCGIFFAYFHSVDNSDYMRNGDYLPTRLQAQQDAVNLVCHAKTRQHPENNIGLVTLGGSVLSLKFFVYYCDNLLMNM